MCWSSADGADHELFLQLSIIPLQDWLSMQLGLIVDVVSGGANGDELRYQVPEREVGAGGTLP